MRREDREFLKPLKGKHVAVGVPHKIEDRPYFFYGTLIDITHDSLILQLRAGIKEINLREIVDVHEVQERGGNE